MGGPSSGKANASESQENNTGAALGMMDDDDDDFQLIESESSSDKGGVDDTEIDRLTVDSKDDEMVR